MEKIGLQLFSIKEITQKDFFGALKQVAETGYDGVEFAGFFNTPAKELKKVMNDLNILPLGCHTGIDPLQKQLQENIEYSLEIGNPYIICPALPPHMHENADAYKRTAEIFNSIGLKCKENGIRFGYHNHGFEFEKQDGEYGLDLLYKNTDPELVYFELDTYWVEYSGLKSVDFINGYGKRMTILHIKDMDNLEEKHNTEIGKGIMDFRGITEAAKGTGIGLYIVEQEEFKIPQLQSIRESLDYLRSIL